MPTSVSVSKGKSGLRRSAASISAGDGAFPSFVTAKSSTWPASTPQRGNSLHERSDTSQTSTQPAICTFAKTRSASGGSLTGKTQTKGFWRGAGR